MSILDAVIGPLGALLDKIIPDPKARDQAKLQLLQLQGTQDMEALKAQLSAILAEAQSPDPWTSRARPSFLYVMYILILWALPMGLIAAFRPGLATGISTGMNGYLAGIPDSLWALFGTGYLGGAAVGEGQGGGAMKGVTKLRQSKPVVDVSLRKIVADEKEGRLVGFGAGVSEAVAHVECSRMAAFTETGEGFEGEDRLDCAYIDDGDTGLRNESTNCRSRVINGDFGFGRQPNGGLPYGDR
jgi:Holin of 3TMs, for gene-transfer release